MKVTKDKGTTVVEVSERELMKYNLTFRKMDCHSLHTKNAVEKILFEAMGEGFFLQKEILLLPDCSDGCVIVCKESQRAKNCPFSFSVYEKEQSEIFSCFFS